MSIYMTGHYLWRGLATERNVFGNNFADPTIQNSKNVPKLQFELQKFTHPKTLQKDTIQLPHMPFTTS
jgi:hypothetical protein